GLFGETIGIADSLAERFPLRFVGGAFSRTLACSLQVRGAFGNPMQNQTIGRGSLADTIVQRIVNVIDEAEQSTQPLEVDPYRSQIFELFVMAEAAGFIDEDSEPDLTADGVCRLLAERWGLAYAARASFEQQTKLPPQHLAK